MHLKKSGQKFWVDILKIWQISMWQDVQSTDHQENAHKTTVRYHYTPSKIWIFFFFKQLARMPNNWNLTHCWWANKMRQFQYTTFYSVKYTFTSEFSNKLSIYLPKRNEDLIPDKNLSLMDTAVLDITAKTKINL